MRRDYHPERAVKEAMQTPQVNDSPALFHEVALRLENLGGRRNVLAILISELMPTQLTDQLRPTTFHIFTLIKKKKNLK